MKNQLVCDTSSLISLSENCLLWILPQLNVELIIPNSVKEELVDKPLHTFRFQLKALRLQEAINEGWIKIVDYPDIKGSAAKLANLANSLLKHGNQYVKIVQEGEAESIALLKKLGLKTLLLDERTTRLLIEDLNSIRRYIENRTNLKLELDRRVANEIEKEMKEINVIRSAELVAWAYEKHLLDRFGKGKEILHAALFSLKFSGCAITNEEIDDYIKILS